MSENGSKPPRTAPKIEHIATQVEVDRGALIEQGKKLGTIEARLSCLESKIDGLVIGAGDAAAESADRFDRIETLMAAATRDFARLYEYVLKLIKQPAT